MTPLQDKQIHESIIEISKHPAICQQLVNFGVPVDIARGFADNGYYPYLSSYRVSRNEKAKKFIDHLKSINFWD